MRRPPTGRVRPDRICRSSRHSGARSAPHACSSRTEGESQVPPGPQISGGKNVSDHPITVFFSTKKKKDTTKRPTLFAQKASFQERKSRGRGEGRREHCLSGRWRGGSSQPPGPRGARLRPLGPQLSERQLFSHMDSTFSDVRAPRSPRLWRGLAPSLGSQPGCGKEGGWALQPPASRGAEPRPDLQSACPGQQGLCSGTLSAVSRPFQKRVRQGPGHF